jgi:hypothetical protein
MASIVTNNTAAALVGTEAIVGRAATEAVIYSLGARSGSRMGRGRERGTQRWRGVRERGF